jgi:hypothetical protein
MRPQLPWRPRGPRHAGGQRCGGSSDRGITPLGLLTNSFLALSHVQPSLLAESTSSSNAALALTSDATALAPASIVPLPPRLPHSDRRRDLHGTARTHNRCESVTVPNRRIEPNRRTSVHSTLRATYLPAEPMALPARTSRRSLGVRDSAVQKVATDSFSSCTPKSYLTNAPLTRVQSIASVAAKPKANGCERTRVKERSSAVSSGCM